MFLPLIMRRVLLVPHKIDRLAYRMYAKIERTVILAICLIVYPIVPHKIQRLPEMLYIYAK
jgi:hypothetical protein